MSNEQQISIQVPKSMAIAYILWLFLGGLGAHRFYLGRTGSAIAQLVLTIIGIVLSLVLVGFVPLIVVGIWLFVDLFLIPGMVRNGPKVAIQATINKSVDQ